METETLGNVRRRCTVEEVLGKGDLALPGSLRGRWHHPASRCCTTHALCPVAVAAENPLADWRPVQLINRCGQTGEGGCLGLKPCPAGTYGRSRPRTCRAILMGLGNPVTGPEGIRW